MTKTSTLHKIFRGILLALACSSMFALIPSHADAYRGRHRYNRHMNFKPRFALSVSAGLTLYDSTYEDEFGLYEDTAFSHGIIGVSGHYWIHPNVSLDLGLDSHFITDYDARQSWGYVSLKPGARLRFGMFYLRGALDLAFADRKDPVLFGFLIGAGIRIPVTRKMRFFSEMNYQYLAGSGYMMPVHFKGGLEMVF